MNTVIYQYRNDENAEWKNVDTFSDFCNKKYLGWDCVKEAIDDNYGKYDENINDREIPDTVINPDKKYIFFKGTEAHKQKLEEIIPEYSIHVENGDYLCKKEDFISRYNEIIVHDKDINNVIRKRADEIIKDPFILFDNEDTGLHINNVFEKRKAEWIRDFEFNENPELGNQLNAGINYEDLFNVLEEKANSYKEEIQRLEVLLNKDMDKHADLVSEIAENKLVKCILSAIESAIDTDKIISRLETKIEKCEWADKLTVDDYSKSICGAINNEIKLISGSTKGRIKKTVTKQLKRFNNDSIKKFKEYTNIYRVISFSDYSEKKNSVLKIKDIKDYELVNELRPGGKKRVLDSKEKDKINDNYGGEEAFIGEVKSEIQSFYIEQMSLFLEDTLGFVKTNVLLYFVKDKYIDLRDLENKINICEFAMKLLKEQYIKLKWLRENPPRCNSDEEIITEEKNVSLNEQYNKLQESTVDDSAENILDMSSGDVSSVQKCFSDDEIKKMIEDAWKCSVRKNITGVEKNTKFILYDSENDLNQYIQIHIKEIDKKQDIIVDVAGRRRLLAKIISKESIISEKTKNELPQEISSAIKVIDNRKMCKKQGCINKK